MIRKLIVANMCIATLSLLSASSARAGICGDESPLFLCESEREGKYIAICAKEDVAGKEWSSVQYRFGLEDNPEMLFPLNAGEGSKRLFFSHEKRRGWYKLSVRFRSGAHMFQIYSDSRGEREGEAGVVVKNRTGKTIAKIGCIERPYVFPSYLQRALACDEEGPHGKAACKDTPYTGKK